MQDAQKKGNLRVQLRKMHIETAVLEMQEKALVIAPCAIPLPAVEYELDVHIFKSEQIEVNAS